MSTSWFFPNIITQIAEAEQHIAWVEDSTGFQSIKTPELNFVGTVKPLLHIANSKVNNIKMKTWYLRLTDFRFTQLPEVISGIELQLDMRRGGRITDETIQLQYQGGFIGDNQATLTLENLKTFGGETNTWGVVSISSSTILDSSFGVGLRFQSHLSWPHRETPMINYAKLRVW